jgi:hypothetical protein
MPSRYSSGKNAIAECDRCGFRYKLHDLKYLVLKTKQSTIKVCQNCWEPDHPQLLLGLYPVNDPQAVREPRSDRSGYAQSRSIQWGWNPVGGAQANASGLLPDDLVAKGVVGTITVTIS